jgi:phage shock protein PspC (stress-responsive transcriptional regulator)
MNPDAVTSDEQPVPVPDSPRRLVRVHEGRLITGVCAGLGRYTGIDPILFRGAFALLALSGWGILFYIAAALLIPAEDGTPSRFERIAHRTLDGDTVLAVLGALLGADMVLSILDNWMSPQSLIGMVVFALAMFVAHARGVDLVQVARALPEGLKGHPLAWGRTVRAETPAYQHFGESLPEGMIDLARFSPTTTPQDSLPDYQPQTYPTRRQPKPRSWTAPVTLLTAIVAAGVTNLATPGLSKYAHLQVTLAAALAVVGLGLVIGAWYGRTHGLVAVGALLAIALSASSLMQNSSTVGHMGRFAWRPANVVQADQEHKVLFGSGTIDLTSVPLSAGQRLKVRGDVTAGQLTVRVPRTARLEVRGQAFLGDIHVDGQIISGPRAKVDQILAPEGASPTSAATIELDIHSRVGDVEVTRV